jgi:hypothetical protein
MMEERKTNLQSFDDSRLVESLTDSLKMEPFVVYVGFNPVYRTVRMEWLDEGGGVQVREDPCIVELVPDIKATLSLMHEKYLGDMGGARVEDLGDRETLTSIEFCSRKRDRVQALQDLLIGKDPNMFDDYELAVDASSSFKRGEHIFRFGRAKLTED